MTTTTDEKLAQPEAKAQIRSHVDEKEMLAKPYR